MQVASRRGAKSGGSSFGLQQLLTVVIGLAAGLVLGWVLMETVDVISTSSSISAAVEEEGRLLMGGAEKRADGSKPTSGRDEVHARPSLVPRTVAQTPLAASPMARAPAPTSASPAVAAAPVMPHGSSIHSVMTSGGSGYQNWQGRIMYATYLMVQKMPGGEVLTGFTRILHRSKPDECMEEIPTFHAKPMHPECEVWCDFPVADRPNAVAQWIASVQQDPSLLKGAWVAVLECDYVWMKPLPSPGDAASAVLGWQYHFGYIIAQHPDCAHIIKRLYDGGDVNEVPNSGPAPAVIRFFDLAAVTPLWEQVTAAIEADKEAVKVLGWVREMYAWDIALAKAKIKLVTDWAPESKLMAQPPSDHTLGNGAIFHYTWGVVYNDATQTVWRWDKRDHTDARAGLRIQPIAMPPPMEEWAQDKWHLQDKLPVTREMHGTIRSMLAQMNKAIETLPDLSAKFDALPQRRRR